MAVPVVQHRLPQGDDQEQAAPLEHMPTRRRRYLRCATSSPGSGWASHAPTWSTAAASAHHRSRVSGGRGSARDPEGAMATNHTSDADKWARKYRSAASTTVHALRPDLDQDEEGTTKAQLVVAKARVTAAFMNRPSTHSGQDHADGSGARRRGPWWPTQLVAYHTP